MHKVTSKLAVVVEFTGTARTGVSTKSGIPKPFWILEAFAQFPGERYPQAFEVFTFDAAQVKPAGFYEVPVVFTRKDGRPAQDLDYSAARPVQPPVAAARAS
ncbi:hypothetical protein D3C84_689220 [compost metagenome]